MRYSTKRKQIILSAWTAGLACAPLAFAQVGPVPAELQRGIEVLDVPAVRPAFGRVVRFGADGPARLREAGRVSIERFPVAAGRAVDLELERFWVTGPDSKFVAGTEQGDVELPPPDVALFRGRVRRDALSQVFLSVHADGGANGFIYTHGDEYVIARLDPARHGVPAGSQLVYSRSDTQPFNPPASFDCDALDAPGEAPVDAVAVATADMTAAVAAVSRSAKVAFECDYEFRQLFSSMTAASNYVAELVGAVSSIYETDIGMSLTASYVRIWDTASDPYTSTSTSGALGELRNYWNTNMTSIPRNAVHLLSGKRSGGGIAYVNQMCGGQYAYGVSGSLNGSFPTPIHNADYGNWDLVVVAHELGHNFRSPHTHCYNPPVDTCYSSDSSCWTGTRTCTQGTIMSYCHLCGGMDNLDLTFGSIVSDYIRTGLQTCIGTVSISNLVYVDWRNSGGENGTLSAPYNTVIEGLSNVGAGGTVSIASGNYPGAATITQAVTLTATGGAVSIGQ